LEIAPNSFRLLELRSTDGYPTILRAEQMETELDYSASLLHEIPYDRKYAKQFISDVTTLLQKRPLFARYASIVLPFTTALITTLPIDTRLSEDEKKAQMNWEIHTLAGASEDTEYLTLPYLLGRKSFVEKYLCVALPQATVNFLRSTFEHLTLSIGGLELDHFSIENGIRLFILDAAITCSAFIGIYDTWCAVSLYAGERYVGFRSRKLTYKENSVGALFQLLESLLSESKLKVESLYVFGEPRASEVADALRPLAKVPVYEFHALPRITFLAGKDAEEAMAQPAHTYDAALCSAWKNLR